MPNHSEHSRLALTTQWEMAQVNFVCKVRCRYEDSLERLWNTICICAYGEIYYMLGDSLYTESNYTPFARSRTCV